MQSPAYAFLPTCQLSTGLVECTLLSCRRHIIIRGAAADMYMHEHDKADMEDVEILCFRRTKAGI